MQRGGIEKLDAKSAAYKGECVNGRDRVPSSARDRLRLDPSAQATRTHLRLSPSLPFGAWEHVGKQILLIADSSTWWLGDWLVFGEDRFPDRYLRAVSGTRLNYGTLRNYAWVARRFEVSRRHDGLSFHHHLEVAALPEAEQDLWLNRAEELKWSKNKLRSELRASRGSAGPDPGGEVADLRCQREKVQLQVPVTHEQKQRWQEAAERAQSQLAGWITDVVDRAAHSVLGGSLPTERAS